MHLALAFIAFAAVIAGSRAARADPLLRSHATALTVLADGALVPILVLRHAHLRPHSLGGLYEKIFLAIELLWLSLVSWSIVSARAGPRPPFSAAA